MTMDLARVQARHVAYQWRLPCWIVLDALERGLRVFCGPHEEYLHGEPDRFYPLEVHHPEGQTETVIGA
jgi:hypothetical protein